MGRVQTQVEELADNRVRLSVEVPSADVKHAVEHAASDLAGSLRIPGFRKGKVPKPELPDWKELEVPFPELEIPGGLVEHELDVLRSSVAELVPVEGRPVAPTDTVVLDLVVP